MDRRVVDKDAVRRAAVKSTRESADLEGRTVPDGFIRSEQIKRFLAERRERR